MAKGFRERNSKAAIFANVDYLEFALDATKISSSVWNKPCNKPLFFGDSLMWFQYFCIIVRKELRPEMVASRWCITRLNERTEPAVSALTTFVGKVGMKIILLTKSLGQLFSLSLIVLNILQCNMSRIFT